MSMKFRNVASRYYGKAGAVMGTALVSVPAFAQETATVDASAATDALGGLVTEIAAIGALLLGAVGVITAWKYLRAGAAS